MIIVNTRTMICPLNGALGHRNGLFLRETVFSIRPLKC